MQTVLTIAGYDPSSGAGITADLLVFAAHGLFGTSCITAHTVQNTVSVYSTTPIPADSVRQTLSALDRDLPIAGVKIGMLGNAEIVTAVAEFLAQLRTAHPSLPVVLDPVLRSSSGRDLLSPDALPHLRKHLLPHVTVITPNREELATLLGEPVPDRDQIPAAATRLQQFSGRTLHVLVTGGDLDPPDDLLLLASKRQPLWISGERVLTRSTHGTGCALSSALLSHLVLGLPPEKAAQAAKAYVTGALRAAEPLGQGRGPLNHLWQLRSATSR